MYLGTRHKSFSLIFILSIYMSIHLWSLMKIWLHIYEGFGFYCFLFLFQLLIMFFKQLLIYLASTCFSWWRHLADDVIIMQHVRYFTLVLITLVLIGVVTCPYIFQTIEWCRQVINNKFMMMFNGITP